MKIETERLETQEALLTVGLEAKRVDKARRAAAKRLSRRVRVPGFRKGKVPYWRVVQIFGEEAILEEVVEELGQKVYGEALDASGLEACAPGTLEDFKADPLVLTFRVPLQPEVKLGAYRDVRVPFEAPEVADEAVDKALQDLRERRALVEEVDRPAQRGDLVVLDIFGELLPEGQERLDDDAEVAPENVLIDEQKFTVAVDAERDLLPGFSAELVGLASGDEKTFTLTIPDDYDDERLRGRRVALDLECLEVRERTLPALNDAFAAEVTDGAHQTLLELRLEVRRQLKKAAEQSAEMTYFEQVMEQVLKGTKLAYAPVMVDEYVDDMLNELEENLQRGGLTLDNFLKIEDKTRAQLQEEYGAKAEERLQRALVLGEVVEAEELNISDEDVEAEIDTMTKEADDPQREALREKYAGENARRSLRMRMLTRQSIERLIAIAKGEDPPKGPARRPKLYEKVSSEYVATLDDLRDEREAESKNANKVSDLFPGARTEKGIARLD